MQRAWCANLARRKERLAAEAVAHTEALEWRLQEAQVRESSSSRLVWVVRDPASRRP